MELRRGVAVDCSSAVDNKCFSTNHTCRLPSASLDQLQKGVCSTCVVTAGCAWTNACASHSCGSSAQMMHICRVEICQFSLPGVK
eukprot:6485209-Amphidinium_carterae.1